MNRVQLKKLSYDEVAKCSRCGFCLPSCPIYLVLKTEPASPRGRNAITRALIEGRLDWSKDIEKTIFRCLGCGACTAACFPSVKTRDVVLKDRECLVNEGFYPKIAEKLAGYLETEHNISNEDNEERGDWQELLGDLPEHYFEKKRADVVYFVGCVASFFPMAQKIPASMVRIMEHAGMDFTVLGGAEWCCGYPLMGAGRPEKMATLMEHNLQKVKNTGAKQIIFTCPSCYHTWKNFYRTDVEILSASEMMSRLIHEKSLRFSSLPTTVTYHDPCDLGRNSGVFEPPREVLKAIPGVQLVELPNNRETCTCCGGGGNLEMVDPELSGQVAQMKIDEILTTGADTVVSSCQQCLRTIASRVRRKKISLKVKDLTELVAEALC
ncbi:MAG: (Fe-S)-binding protein [Desulfatiglandaceae bacterium]|jgi:heterodisulfide reductase subunit D